VEPAPAKETDMAKAFLHVYAAGRQLGAEEERNRDLPPSYGRQQ